MQVNPSRNMAISGVKMGQTAQLQDPATGRSFAVQGDGMVEEKALEVFTGGEVFSLKDPHLKQLFVAQQNHGADLDRGPGMTHSSGAGYDAFQELVSDSLGAEWKLRDYTARDGKVVYSVVELNRPEARQKVSFAFADGCADHKVAVMTETEENGWKVFHSMTGAGTTGLKPSSFAEGCLVVSK